MVIASLVAAMILFSLSNRAGIPMPYLLQGGAILCLTATVYLLVRYSLKIYRYAVEPNGIVDGNGVEQYDLVITEIVGKRRVVVARVALRDIDRAALTVMRRGEDKQTVDEICRERKVFRYANTPAMPVSCYIPLPEEGAVVVIPADEAMVRILKGGNP
jgi:hypothetical protein